MTLPVPPDEMRRRVCSRVQVLDCGYVTHCWISDRVKQPNGYTKIGVGGSTLLTHRVAYEAFIGPIPDGLQIDHRCKQKACCNPDHLEPVTCRENLLRGDTLTAAQVAATHCKRGHPYDEANNYIRADRPGVRGCRACRNSWRLRAAQRHAP